MDHVYSTTTEHQKGKHLSYDERILIQVRLKDGWSANKIAREIGCAPNTVRFAIQRSRSVLQSESRSDCISGIIVYERSQFTKISVVLP